MTFDAGDSTLYSDTGVTMEGGPRVQWIFSLSSYDYELYAYNSYYNTSCYIRLYQHFILLSPNFRHISISAIVSLSV